MRKSNIILTSNGFLDYDRILDPSHDPFAFLASLKSGDLAVADDFDPDALASNRLVKNGAFDLDLISQEVDIAKMVRSVLNDTAMVPKDIKIDDGDFPLAKNIYEWVSKDSFGGTVMTPFLEQLVWGVITFSEWCPLCSDNEYLFETHKVDDSFTKFLSKIQLLENGVCPSCKGRRSHFVRSGLMNFYQELAIQAGQRSGKTACVGGILTPYMTHRVLKMQKPCDIYGIASSTMLHGTFCALTYSQAKETLWEFYYGTLCSSEWFKGYHGMLRYYEGRYGQTLLKLNDTSVVYRPRNLMWYPAGPDKRILRGRTRIFGGVDEIGYFDNDAASNKVKTSAHHVYDALDASLLTVRGAAERLLRSGFDDILTAYAMNVSSPASYTDKICSLVRQAKGSSTMYGVHAPTWKVNPDFPRDCKVIVDAYTRNPLDAERNFGANPPMSANPFLGNQSYIENAFSKKRKNQILILDVIKNRKKTNKANKWAEIIKCKQDTKPSLLTIDAGVAFNSFAITVLRPDEETGKLRCTLMCEVLPEPGIPLNYTKMYDSLISPLIETRNVKVMLADRWNSLKILSDAEADHNIVAEQYSLKYKDICFTRSHLEAGSLILPSRETEGPLIELLDTDKDNYPHCFKGRPADHLALQMMTVQDVNFQVIKGDGLTDDLWRSLCLGVWGLSTDKYAELLVGDSAPIHGPVGPLGVSRLASSGGGSGLTSSGTSTLGVMVQRR